MYVWDASRGAFRAKLECVWAVQCVCLVTVQCVFSQQGEGGELACWWGWFSAFLVLVQYSRMFQILGISYVGWICAWWSTISIWCVYVLDMGVCASSGSVGFWPIIPAALRSQLRSHAHIWHSFTDMITIHLPLWVWLRGIFPSFPSGTGATFQKWTTHPHHRLYPLLSRLYPTPTPRFSPTPLSPLYTTPLQHRFLLPCNRNPLVQPFFPPESAVCVCRHDWVIWQRHLFSDLLLGQGRKGRDEGGIGAGQMRREAAMKLYLTTACFPSTALSDPSCCIFMAELYNVELPVDLCTTVGAQQFS